MQPPEYAGLSGIRLLEDLATRHGVLFTTEEAIEAAKAMKISASHAYKLLHELARSGYVRRLPKSLYVIESPIAGGTSPHSFAIATRLVRPSAISHWSALHHWELVEQIPMSVTASTPKTVVTPDTRGSSKRDDEKPTHRAWVIDGIRYEFVRIPEKDMFGIEEVWIDSTTRVPIFDRERALLDTFLHLKGFGAGGLGEQILAQHWKEVDSQKLFQYAARMERPRLMQRARAAWSRVSGETAIARLP